MIKRLFDISIAISILAILIPFLAILAIAIRIKLGSPILFKQTRIGLHEKSFIMIKFRTMTDAVDDRGKLLPVSDRLTPFGQKLRNLSLDELPELWNVIKGDMSIVGPRPLLPDYLPLYSTHQRKRHNSRPGITGWAQVNGRNAISWKEKLDYDVWYIDNQSIYLDFLIICKTVGTVFSKKGIDTPGQINPSRFTGNDQDD